jgi:hypothetical protein
MKHLHQQITYVQAAKKLWLQTSGVGNIGEVYAWPISHPRI